MGTAIQIEMALDQARRFEDELQLLFMQAGKGRQTHRQTDPRPRGQSQGAI
jgi:hypothetical protein